MGREKACGAIIIKDKKVLLIQQNDGNWGFPKGHVEEGETEEQTAIREVKEETNIDVIVDTSKRYAIEYELLNGNMKEAVFFVAKPTSEDLKRQETEIATIEWVDFVDVDKKLSFENTREVFRKVLRDL